MSTQTATPRADLHTHTALCKHASGTPEEYLAAAQKARLAYWGVSDHFPAPAGYDAEFRMAPDDLPCYFGIVFGFIFILCSSHCGIVIGLFYICNLACSCIFYIS